MRWTKSKKAEQLAKYKRARAEHVAQVQEDEELIEQLDREFKVQKNRNALEK